MANFYKKLSNARNYYKKLEAGANNFFKKLPSAEDAVNSGIDYLRKNNIPRKIANTLEKVANVANAIGSATGNPIASQLGNLAGNTGAYIKTYNKPKLM